MDEQNPPPCTECLTINLLTTTIVAPPSNARKWQMGFNLAFKGLTWKSKELHVVQLVCCGTAG
jgi:hypothetical protein